MSTYLDNTRGFTDYIVERLSENLNADRIIPLDEVGQFAYVDVEGAMIYLVTVQQARLVPASNQDQPSQESSPARCPRCGGGLDDCRRRGACTTPASTQAPSASERDDARAARRLATGASDSEEGSGTDSAPPRGVAQGEDE